VRRLKLGRLQQTSHGIEVLKGHGFSAVPLTPNKRYTARLKPRPFNALVADLDAFSANS